jgi:peptide-methionine (R)-S-oxide reductase
MNHNSSHPDTPVPRPGEDLMACGLSPAGASASNSASPQTPRLSLTDAQWRAQLTDEQYRILREKGTERAFTGKFWNHHEQGTYVCAGCGQPLYESAAKFESGTGWPSFVKPVAADAVAEQSDHSHFMRRTEVLCSRCGGHLGHVFTDGPAPTGLRYCINSASLKFIPRDASSSKSS